MAGWHFGAYGNHSHQYCCHHQNHFTQPIHHVFPPCQNLGFRNHFEPTTELVELTVYEYEDGQKKKRPRKQSRYSSLSIVDLSNGKAVPKPKSRKPPKVHTYRSKQGYTVEEPVSD